MIYNGLTVLLEDPNRRDDPMDQYNITKVRQDSLTGPFNELIKGTANRPVRPFSWYMPDRAHITAFEAFLAERVGQLVPFYVPTWHHDLIMTTDPLLGDNFITVKNVGYNRLLFDAHKTFRRYLALIQHGVGVKYIRRVESVLETPTEERLTLDAALTEAMFRGQWMISFLTLCRLNSDEVALHWHSPTIAEATLEFVELPTETPTL
jgi:hypothetical protein